MKSKKKILLIEDNLGDSRLIEEAIQQMHSNTELDVVTNGIQALDYLYQRNSFSKVKLPDLILLDLNVPKKNGKEILFEIKNDEKLKIIPIIVLTISQAEDDVLQCYQLHANSYVIKPFEIDTFFSIFEKLIDYWFNVVKLPQEGTKLK